MTITVYTFEDGEGHEYGFVTQDYGEAKAHAADRRLKIIANEYEWADSEVVADFTGEGDEDEEVVDDAGHQD